MKKHTGSQQPSAHREKRTITTTIRQRQFISATPEEIYDAYLDEQKHAQFTGAVASCQRFVGGTFSAWNGYITAKNVALENGRRIVHGSEFRRRERAYPDHARARAWEDRHLGLLLSSPQ